MKADLRRFQGRCGQDHKEFIASGDGLALAHGRAAALDTLLLSFWRKSGADGYSLIALGEYGRSELYPHSPVSLLLLGPDGDGPSLEPLSGAQLQFDVRRAPMPETGDLPLDLLDARFVAGNEDVYEELKKETLPSLMRREHGALLMQLIHEVQARHQEFDRTVYIAEPDVMRSPGGLLDCHLVDVLTRLLEIDPAPWREGLQAARRFLAAERAHLHLLGRGDANILTFARQEQVAARAAKAGGPASAAEWMRMHFRHARHVDRLARHLLMLAVPDRRHERIASADFTITRGEVFLRHPSGMSRNPELWIEMFTFAARHGAALGLETERRLERSLHDMAAWAREMGDLWPAFRDILTEQHAYSALAAMRDLGALGAIFPEFKKIESSLLRDGYHRYTEDQHSLLAIQHLHDLRPDSRFGLLMEEVEHLRPLLLALFVDRMGEIPARLAVSEPERELTLFLLEHRRLMASTVSSRHIADPAIVQDFASRAGTAERLRMLCLFTYATLKAVGPAALTSWKEEALWRLYAAAQEELTRRLDSDRATPAETLGVFRPEVVEFLEGFPRRYLKTHTPAEILSHFHLAQDLAKRPVQMGLTHHRNHYRLLVLTQDHPFLFASITGTLAALGMNILKAEAFSNRRGLILDTFEFEDLHRSLENNAEQRRRLLATMEEAISGRTEVAKLIGNRLASFALRRGGDPIPNEIHFDNSASATSTLLEVVTNDRPGLLYRISSMLSAHECNIEVVLVDTQGHKAKDVFYITRHGAALDLEWQAALRNELMRVLSG